jgi:predicted nucleic acid-binding protein
MLIGDFMGRISSNISVVCDAGPIIHLDELACLHLMRDFDKVLVPTSVRREVLKHRLRAFEETGVRWFEISERYELEEPLGTMCRVFALDAGEVEALAVLKKEPGLIFLTDDAGARLVATKLGFRVHGTIGVLIRAIRRDLMNPKEVLDTLNRIPSVSSLHIKMSLLQEVISSVRQEFEH